MGNATAVSAAAPAYRRDAFKQTYQGPVVFEDRKGAWSVGWVRREYSPGWQRYRVDVTLTPAPGAGLKLSSQKHGYASVRPDTDVEAFKESLKWAVGYIPTSAVVEAMLARVQQLLAALIEEDHYYATADKGTAKATLAALKNRALGRYRRGECLVAEAYRHHYQSRPSDLYLTREERETAREAQKVLNGDGMESQTMTESLDSELLTGQYRIDQEKAAEALRRKRRQLGHLMETDPDFRRLVAHYAQAVTTAKGELHLELGYRLFGYCRSIDEWRKNVVEKLQAQLRQYGLDMFEVRELQRLATAERDVLPRVEAPYDRKPGEFYYGDRVVIGDASRCHQVDRSGREYVDLSSGGGRQRKELVQHYDIWLRSRQAKAAPQ